MSQGPAAASTRVKKRTGLAIALLICWGVGVVAAFWWYDARWIRPFSESSALLSAPQLQLPIELQGSGKIRFVHFYDPQCPCQNNTLLHLEALIEKFQDQPIEFYLYSTEANTTLHMNGIQHLTQLTGAEQISLSPAAAIWRQNGELAYFGPYSNSAICSINDSLIEPVLEALLQQRPVNSTSSLSVGCFCPWQNPAL